MGIRHSGAARQGTRRLQTLERGSVLRSVMSAAEKASGCSPTGGFERSCPSHWLVTQGLMRCFQEQSCGRIPPRAPGRCGCRCLRHLSPGAHGGLLFFPLLHIISETLTYFLFVKAGFHRLHGRETARPFNFQLAAGSSLPWEDHLSSHRESHSCRSVRRLLRLSEMTLRFFCVIKL